MIKTRIAFWGIALSQCFSTFAGTILSLASSSAPSRTSGALEVPKQGCPSALVSEYYYPSVTLGPLDCLVLCPLDDSSVYSTGLQSFDSPVAILATLLVNEFPPFGAKNKDCVLRSWPPSKFHPREGAKILPFIVQEIEKFSNDYPLQSSNASSNT